MRTLFFRIFAWFWLAVVVLAITFAGTIVTTRFTESREHLHAFQRAVAFSARAAAVTYQQFGAQGLENLIDPHEANASYAYFFDEHQTELQGLDAPAEAKELARTLLFERVEMCRNRAPWIACKAVDSSGARYVLVTRFRVRQLVSPREWAILIPALMLVAGLVCFWLASYLTKPISCLRRLTRRFADGDLQARVENHSAFRHSEELQGLAHDFDRMAEQIQGLIERQKHLLWDVSHELRTPLTRIGLATGLMRQRLATAPPKELNRIDREIERLNRLIGQILTIARIDAGTKVEHRCDLDLSALVNEIAEQARLEADARDITIHGDCEPSVHIFGSPELLRMAIENVLRNAIRHTPQTSIVTVQLRRSERHVSLSICDQGPGVEVNDLGRLFDPFFRSEDARLNHPGGTGLGLALARRVVGWHSGSIRAFNRSGGGLVVRIFLPTEEHLSPSAGHSLAVANAD